MSEKLLPRVYIAGPYTKGDTELNVQNAMVAGDLVIEAGGAPLVPHWTHFQHTFRPHDYETWMTIDFSHLVNCDALWRIPGESVGADREVAFAHEHGIPVLRSHREVAEFLRTSKRAPAKVRMCCRSARRGPCDGSDDHPRVHRDMGAGACVWPHRPQRQRSVAEMRWWHIVIGLACISWLAVFGLLGVAR